MDPGTSESAYNIKDVNDTREKTESIDDISYGQQLSKEALSFKANNTLFQDHPNEIPKDKCSNSSNTTVKATNWIMILSAEYSKVIIMKENLLSNASIIAVSGRIQRDIGLPLESKLQTMIKMNKQTTKSSILKLLEVDAMSFPSNKFSLEAVTEANKVKILLGKLRQEKNTSFQFDLFGKGEFKYSRCKKKKDVNPIKLIEEYGISKAELLWAEQKLPRKIFEDAVSQYSWEQEVKNKHKRCTEAQESLKCLKPWQDFIHNIFLQEPDSRSIYVILDKEGGKGKTYLQNVMKDAYPDDIVNISNGRTKDITSLVRQGVQYKLIQMNVPRQNNKGINLEAIEMIKDGNFASMKYKPKSVRSQPPHFFIYTNNELKWTNLTTDRWRIIHLHDQYKDGFELYSWDQWKYGQVLAIFLLL